MKQKKPYHVRAKRRSHSDGTRRVQMKLWVTVAAICWLAPTVRAEQLTAKQHFELGMRSFDLGQFEESAQEFEMAFKLSGEPSLLFNAAQAYRQAHNFGKALFFYKTYVANYGRRGAEPANKSEVDQRINECNQQLGTVAMPAHMPVPASVKAGARPLASGESKPASRRAPEKPIEASSLVQAVPVISLRPEAPLPRWVRPVSAAGLGLGAAALVVGGVMVGLAGDTASKVGASSGEFTSTLSRQDRLGQRYDQAGIGLFVAGGVLAAAGAVGVGLSFRGRSGVTASLVPGPGLGLAAAGQF